ncbi:MAG: CHAT domain-containing protein [Bacteroidales bacterium]|nr:CHAT domain-containing protein [Bacteroidales bacterium]
MKRLLILILFLLPMLAIAQSNESNQLYSKGVELFNAKKYTEALSYFQKCDSLDKATMEPSSENYYRAELKIADCKEGLVMLVVDAGGSYEDLVTLEMQVVQIRKKILGEDHPDYARALAYLAIFYNKLQNTHEAIRIGIIAVEKNKKIYGKDHPYYILSLKTLANNYFKIGNYTEAIKYQTDVNEYNKSAYGEWHPNYATSLNLLARCYASIDNYKEAVRLCTIVVEIRKKALGEEHPLYATALTNLADYYFYLGNYTEAIRLGKIAMETCKKVFGEEDLDYATSLSCLADYYYANGDFAEAIRLQTKAMEIKKKTLGEEHLDYATSLSDLAQSYAAIGNYTEAIRLGTLAVEICKKVLGDQHPDYATSLSILANSYRSSGNSSEAIRLENIALDIRKKALGEKHLDYGTSQSNLAQSYAAMGNYTEAIRCVNIAIEICKKVLGEQHPTYAVLLNNLATYYNGIGNYNEAVRLCNEVLEMRKKTLGEEHSFYAASLGNLASCYYYIGNFTEAIKLQTKQIEITKKTLGEDHLDYITSLNNLAQCYTAIGNYTEAIRLGTLVTEIVKKNLDEGNPDYVKYLNNLAGYYADIDNYAEAIRLGSIAIEISKNGLGEEHLDYAKSLNNLASYYVVQGNFDEAIRLENRAMSIFKKSLGEEHPLYATSLNNLASMYLNSGNFSEALRLGNLALDIRKKTLGEQHPDYAIALCAMGDYNLVAGNSNKAAEFYKESYDCTTSFILKNFASMTTKERSDFWKKNSVFISKDLPYAAYVHPYQTLNALAYDGLVFSKGLLLNAELEIQNLIEKSGDTTFSNRYYKIKQDRALLDALYETAVEERDMDVDSLAKAIENEERLLVESSKELGDFTKNLTINWKEIQKNLKDNDVAVEFAAVEDTATDQSVYFAFVLKKGMKAPEMVKLCNYDEFSKVKTREYYSTPKLYNLVWKPLSQYLQDAENVYFSPVDRLHTIGIEYLPDEDETIFAEKYNAYRLSSTRELAMAHNINGTDIAATLGGIKYDDSNGDSNGERGGASYLPGTKAESEQVENILHSAKYYTIALTDTMATEERFKKLAGINLKILHIGTHGFYMDETDMENAGFKFYTSTQQSEEDRALSCSGLLLAGANNTLDFSNRNTLSEGADDGVLTAKEVARLDFRGLELVVLSACQTGLGSITGEGVFGLQRGFKKAGAQTIVMSLWEVSDQSTQLLMIEFFKNLTSGMSKRAAFLAAQKVVRAKFPNPLDWAAFVMVDGV